MKGSAHFGHVELLSIPWSPSQYPWEPVSIPLGASLGPMLDYSIALDG